MREALQRARQEINTWPQERIDEWHERAAIMQYDGGLSRENADLLAWKAIKEEMKNGT